jgi:hypothetical protein
MTKCTNCDNPTTFDDRGFWTHPGHDSVFCFPHDGSPVATPDFTPSPAEALADENYWASKGL